MFESFSFSLFHADSIPTSLTARLCPTIDCEWIRFKNNADSTGNVVIGSHRLAVVGTGIVLEPGQQTGWIAVTNLNLFWHKETDVTTTLEYAMVGNAIRPPAVLLQEVDRYPLLLEDGQRIRL